MDCISHCMNSCASGDAHNLSLMIIIFQTNEEWTLLCQVVENQRLEDPCCKMLQRQNRFCEVEAGSKWNKFWKSFFTLHPSEIHYWKVHALCLCTEDLNPILHSAHQRDLSKFGFGLGLCSRLLSITTDPTSMLTPSRICEVVFMEVHSQICISY